MIYTYNFNRNRIYQAIINHNLIRGFNLSVVTKPTAPHKYSKLNPTKLSDIERVWIAHQNPQDTICIDGDTVIDRVPDFPMEPGKVYIYQGRNPCVLIPNGATEVIKKLWASFDGINHPTTYISMMQNELKNDIRPIPDGYFRHLGIGFLVKNPPPINTSVGTQWFTMHNKNGRIKIQIGVGSGK
jgi:hypothetical protein